jgi:hypothetical protein
MLSASFVRNLCWYAAVGVPLSWSTWSVAETAPASSQPPLPAPAASPPMAAPPIEAPDRSAQSAAALSTEAQPKPSEAACLPACRSGYTCIAGRCVSACNPPCDAGEFCTRAGQCEARPVAERGVQAAPAAVPDKKVDVAPEPPRTHIRNPSMLVGGMLLSSVGAFVGLLGYSTIYRDQFRCEHGQSASCSTSKASVALVVSGMTMFAVGIPFIVAGAWRVPDTAKSRRVSDSRAEGTILGLGPSGLLLRGTF